MKRKKTFLFIYSLFLLVFLFTILLSSIPSTPIAVKKAIKDFAQNLFPEGWAFFTINPQKERYYFYKINNDSLELLNLRSSDFRNFFGLSRRIRLVGIESAIIIQQVEEKNKWISCNSFINECMQTDTIPTYSVINNSRMQNIAGEYIIVKAKPKPWEWNSLNYYPTSYIIKISTVKKNAQQ